MSTMEIWILITMIISLLLITGVAWIAVRSAKEERKEREQKRQIERAGGHSN